MSRVVVVVGAGQLGSRHLQGLAQLESVDRLIAVDPSSDALARAQVLLEGATTAHGGALEWLTDVGGLPAHIDYAVVATSADSRRSAVESLLAGRAIGHLLLEKVLFQRVDDYAEVGRLIDAAGVDVRVDTPRRTYPIYREVKEFFADSPITHLDVRGGGWGLACNSIHFVDLLAYLTDGLPRRVSTAGLRPRAVPSKRPGFYEFDGTLTGLVGSASFSLTATDGSPMPVLVTLRSDTKTCLIDEAAGTALFREETRTWRQIDFPLRYVSEMTTDFARDALSGRGNGLPSFAESAACHLPVVGGLADHAAAVLDIEPGYCPIT
jgi:predicted dehydrogenase